MQPPDARPPRAAAPAPSAPPDALFLDALGDGIYGVDADGRCTFVNRAALDILRYGSAEELLGRNMHALVHHIRPDGSAYPVLDCPLLHTLTTGRPVRLDNELLWRRDGSSFFAEYSSFPVMVDGVATGSVVTFVDLSVRRDGRRRLAAQHAVAQVLAGEAEADDVRERLLAAIGSGFGWTAGALWLAAAGGGLDRAATWRAPGAAADAPSEGLAGRAFAGGAPLADADDVAFPASTDGERLGVLAFAGAGASDLADGGRDALATLGH
ncbi:PAS domain-containing protein [Lichenibacterium dinghuense]|uniref:PAS domain-containing protein n=1 Tax=Lichenibacterium dinghuense TaxID=2895977 RepID=UPI001F19CF37|nr:PAS domain-containing protein [Lichenibacterium sp. 6Y81]